MSNSSLVEINHYEAVVIRIDEYQSLLEDRMWLNALRDAGVDNWRGIEFASELFDKELAEKQKRDVDTQEENNNA